MARILAITDMDDNGSGYKNVCAPLFTGLTKLGHEIKVAGIMYRGLEHDFPFSVIPARDLQEGQAIATNLIQIWKPDVLIVALDLPIQSMYHNQLMSRFKIPYIAITPIENGPLTMSWAAPLFNMDAVFFISELGKQEAIKSGVYKAEHLVVGVDTESWKPATSEQKLQLRKGLGIPENAFVILTVADNQERKNLSAAMEAVSLLKKETDRPIRYIMVTREQSPYGWKLRDLAVSFDINQEWMCFERGIPQKDLWGLYAVSDVYLQTSKAEGLGLPVLDAMACGVPVVATKTGALVELLEDGRGCLVPGYQFGKRDHFVDVWGNSRRVMINIEEAKNFLKQAMESPEPEMVQRALEYVKQRTWDTPVKQVHDKVEEIIREQQEKQKTQPS